MSATKYKILLVYFMIFFFACGRAQEQNILQGIRFAFIIGVADYDNDNWDLQLPVTNAEQIADALKKVGFLESNIIILRNPTYQEIVEKFREFSNKIQEQNIQACKKKNVGKIPATEAVLFYFCGHGAMLQETNYLLPRDVRSNFSKDIQDKGISLGLITERLQTTAKELESDNEKESLTKISGGQLNIIWADTCSTKIEGYTITNPKVPSAKGFIIDMASSPGQSANDGLFTKKILEYIDSGLEIVVMMDQVRSRVSSESNGFQVPVESNGKIGFFYFSKPKKSKDEEFFQKVVSFDQKQKQETLIEAKQQEELLKKTDEKKEYWLRQKKEELQAIQAYSKIINKIETFLYKKSLPIPRENITNKEYLKLQKEYESFEKDYLDIEKEVNSYQKEYSKKLRYQDLSVDLEQAKIYWKFQEKTKEVAKKLADLESQNDIKIESKKTEDTKKIDDKNIALKKLEDTKKIDDIKIEANKKEEEIQHIVTEYGLPENIWKNCQSVENNTVILDMATETWLNLSWEEQVKYAQIYQENYAKFHKLEIVKNFYVSNVAFKMRLVPPGVYLIGSSKNDSNYNDDEKQARIVILYPFYLGEKEISQEQWKIVMGKDKNFSHWKDDTLPIEKITYQDAADFCNKLEKMSGQQGFRLPVEYEWEYCCRAGTTTSFNLGEEISLAKINYDDETGEYRKKTIASGTIENANAWGFFDMHGNITEYCCNTYEENYSSKIHDPNKISMSKKNNLPAIRGGSWGAIMKECRSAYRAFFNAGSDYRLGMRILKVF